MPKLTTAAVAKYVAGSERREIRDSQAPGLHLIIQPKPTGAKSWAMRFRRPDGKAAKLTLGKVDLSDGETADEPTLGGALTLRQARQLANKIDRDRARGIDVIEEYRAQKSRARASAVEAAAHTFTAAVREYFSDHKTKRGARPRRWRDDARLIGLRWPRGVDPAAIEPEVIKGGLADTWSTKPISEIDGHDIHTVVDDARRRGTPGLKVHNHGSSESRGRKMFAALSGVFRYLLQHRKVVTNPTLGLWHPGAPPARERTLSDDEIKKFWYAAVKVRAPYGAAARLLLLTGARLNEVSGMRRIELSSDNLIWTIPSERTKNHRAHVMPLPPLARSIIAELPATEDYVFGKHLTTWPRAKAELDAAMGVKGWRLHDLRRTAATEMAELGIAPHIVEAVLNHVSGARAGVAGIYNRAQYADEKRAALVRWAAHIEGLVSGKPANVTALRRGRR